MIKHLTFDDSASLAGSSITASYQTLIAMSDDADFLFLYNTTNVALLFTIPSGANATKEIRLPTGASLAIDCRTNSKRIAKGTIQVKHVGTAPSTGEVCITVAR